MVNWVAVKCSSTGSDLSSQGDWLVRKHFPFCFVSDLMV